MIRQKTFLFILLCLVLGLCSNYSFGQKVKLTGQVSSFQNRSPLPFANVFIEGTTMGTYTKADGTFELTISQHQFPDTFYVAFSFSGYKNQRVKIIDGKAQSSLFVLMQSKTFKEVEIVATKNADSNEVQRNQMSVVNLKMKDIQYLPAIGGEVDIIKVIQLLPGVSGGIEGTIGMFVRGGNADQNLVLLDKAPVYEFGHLFGFYSVFNIDAVDNINMIKGGFPAEFGGRLSSILDIEMHSPNDNKFHAKGGIGLLSSRATLDFPIIKEKVHLSISGRRTYIDQVVKLIDENIPYYFYDLNAKLSAKLSPKDNLYYTTYFGKDILSEPTNRGPASGNFGFIKTNWINSLRWQHIIDKKSTFNTYAYNTRFNYDVDGSFDANGLSVVSSLYDYGLKSEYKRYLTKRTSMDVGLELIHHDFTPNIVNTSGEVSDFIESGSGEALGFQGFAIYGGSEFEFFNSLLKIKPGLRLSGALIKNRTYVGLEPRLTARYTLNDQSSIKASYSRMNQYIHRVSSASVALPTDMWYPVTNNVKPQSSDQIALGYEYFLSKLKTRITVEGYTKWMRNVIEYREGANLFVNNDFEEELVQGKGMAYGLEFLVRRNAKKLSGWVAYTLSWSNRNFSDLNGGRTFFARYDRRHDVSITLNYPIVKRIHLSCIWVYSTGSRFTPQTGNYATLSPSKGGIQLVPVYADRNSVSLSASHRLDLNLVIKPKYKANRKWYGELNVGVYNVYNRASPYTIQITGGPNGLRYEQPGIFGFLPSIAYNFKFN